MTRRHLLWFGALVLLTALVIVWVLRPEPVPPKAEVAGKASEVKDDPLDHLEVESQRRALAPAEVKGPQARVAPSQIAAAPTERAAVLDDGYVSGQVLDRHGKPISGAVVQLLRPQGTPLPAVFDGTNFRIGPVHPGSYDVTASAADRASVTVQVDVPRGGERRDLMLLLQDGATVQGKVTAQGKPVVGAILTLTTDTARQPWQTTTNENGEFSVRGVGTGMGHLQVRASGYITETIGGLSVPWQGTVVNDVALQPAEGAQQTAEQGVGITVKSQDNHIEITNVMPDSPAAGAGIQSGDRLLRIDGRACASVNSTAVQGYLLGTPGGRMVIEYEHGGQTQTAVLTTARLLHAEP